MTLSMLGTKAWGYRNDKGAPSGNGIQDGLQLLGAHIARDALVNLQSLRSLVQLAFDDAAVEAVCDQQVLQLADVAQLQLLQQLPIRY